MSRYINISKSHEIIKTIKQLKASSKPKHLYLVEDLSILKLCMENRNVIDTFVFCDELEYSPEANELIEYCLLNAKQSYSISNKTFQSIESKDNSIGIIALVEKNQPKLKDLSDFVLVLDRLENAGNVGTLLRTADACKIKDIILVDKTVNPNNVKLIQSSRGMALTENIYELTYNEALEYLQNNNYNIYLGEPVLGKQHTEYNYEGKTAIVIGHERYGINPDWYNHKHIKVYIPMYGKMTSLNVAVAGSILMYEARMKKGLQDE